MPSEAPQEPQAEDYERAIGQAIRERGRLQDEGHASVISSERDPLTGGAIVIITVTRGRPKGWSDVYGDDDMELSLQERAHLGLDLPPV